MPQWAHANGCPWDAATCNAAGVGGNLEILQWLRANGCEWDEETCGGAVEGEHRDMFVWALENGSPISGETLEYAGKLGWPVDVWD